MTAGLALRAARAGVLGFVVVASTTSAHAAAGGPLPAAPMLLGFMVLTSLVVAPLLGRELPILSVIALVVVSQTVLHEVLTLLMSASMTSLGTPATLTQLHASTPTPMTMHMPVAMASFPDMASPSTMAPSMAPSMAGSTGPAGGYSHSALTGGVAAQLPMAAAHLVAGALVGWWLGIGERGLWRLLHLLAASTPTTLARVIHLACALRARPISVPRCIHRSPLWLPPVALLGLLGSRATSRRGPPALYSA